MDLNSNTYYYTLQFPSDNPPADNVTWYALTLDTNGVCQDGVSWQAQGNSNSQVTVSVENGLAGDVLLCAAYLNSANQLVQAGAVLVYSQGPAGASLTGFELLPYNPTLTSGAVVPIMLLANYSDGTACLRALTSNSLTAVSSDPRVVSVADPLNWKLLAPGTAEVSANWSGLSFTNLVTVIAAAKVEPELTINAAGTNTRITWPYWASPYTLESCTNLGEPNWQAVAGTLQTNGTPDMLQTNGGSISLSVPPGSTSAYFRLVR
jgi:hypothetical protein